MPAAVVDIIIEQGVTFRMPILLSDADGNATNLTGYTAKGQVRTTPGGKLLADFTFEGSFDETGAFEAVIDEDITAGIKVASAVYDILITPPSGSGDKERLLRGVAIISPSVTVED